MDQEMKLISRLQDWFCSECNADWEHSYGFRLETLDNPGWTFEADLVETRWASLEIAMQRVDRSDSDWVQFEVSQGKYVACGGPLNLGEMLQKFFDVIDEWQATSL